MFIKTFKFKRKLIFIIFIILLIFFLTTHYITSAYNDDYIKWVDFNVTSEVLTLTSKLDIESHNNDHTIKYNWIELISYLGAKYGGNFDNFSSKDLDDLICSLDSGSTITELTSNFKNYNYYYEAYSAVLSEFIGTYWIQTTIDGETIFKEKYGLKNFSPIAKGYYFHHYDDFGNSRSYGFSRTHLGNDLMGSIGTPIIATESGIVENIGWNQYGGWRIGIKSFDDKRYYYYAHLQKDTPYSKDLQKGSIVKAGDVIGYLGMTGYSIKENVNNVNIPHLHFGIQLIFDESQIDSPNEIWIDVYEIIKFLNTNTSEVYKSDSSTNEFIRKYDIFELFTQD